MTEESRHMKDFASRFTPEEWEKLCSHQIFLDTFSLNLREARLIAERILAGKPPKKSS